MLRPYRSGDASSCWAMLAAEGMAEHEMHFRDGISGVLEEGKPVGFFTLEFTDGLPSLRHFCLAREHRGADRARRLIRAVRSVVRQAGYRKFLVHAKQRQIARLTQHYFRTKPYGFAEDGAALFLVRV